MLERTQSGGLDVSDWLDSFLGCLPRAIDGADAVRGPVLRKADFWQRYAGEAFSARQKTVLNRYMDGLEGKLTAKKWAAIGKCSVPTAQRDIFDLCSGEAVAGGTGEYELRGGGVIGLRRIQPAYILTEN